MSATIEGTTLQQQATEIEADGASGSSTLRWVGTRTEIEALAISMGLVSGGHKYSIVPHEVPELAILTWTIATGPDGSTTETDDPISTDWQIETPSEVVPLTEHQDWVTEAARFNRADPLLYTTFLQYWNDEAEYSDIADSAWTSISRSYPFLWAAVAMKKRGVKGYYRGAPTLSVIDRFQRQAPNAADTATVNVAYTRSKLISALRSRPIGESIPSDISANLKEGEWLCESVSRRTSGDGAREVTQTFRWAPKWDNNLYEHS